MNNFVVLITSYNVEKWALKNISSVIEQKYNNFKIFYVDDCSTDDTLSIIKNELKRKIDTKRYKLVKNSYNKGKMENVVDSVRDSFILENDIIVILDGDDWLYDNDVLNKLNLAYGNTNKIWMTAGSYVESDTGNIITPKMDVEYWQDNIRKKSWQASHLVSFKKKLFMKIKRKHFMKKTGEYFSTTSDQAMVWPMLEMSGNRNFKVIKESLYVYNRENPLSDDKIFRKDQLNTERYVRKMPPYEKLDNL